MATSLHPIEPAIRRIHRRSLIVVCARQVAAISAIVLGCFIVVLAFGTRLITWPWLVFLVVLGASASLFRLRGRLPNPYNAAQVLDARLRLDDTVSTAWHVIHAGELAKTVPGQVQLAQAESALKRVDPAEAFPLPLRQFAFPGVLAGLVAALVAVHFMVHGGIDLKHPLLPLRMPSFHTATHAGEQVPGKQARRSDDVANSPEADERRTATTADSKMSDIRDQKPSGPAFDNPDGLPPSMAAAAPSNVPESGPQGPGGDDRSGNGTSGNASSRDLANASAKESDQSGGQRGDGDSQGNKEHSLMNRMKDAMSSLMSKMKPTEKTQRSTQASARNAAAPDQDQSETESNSSQSQNSTPQSQKGNASTDAKNNQPGQAIDLSQPAQSQTASSSARSSNDQSKSGIGKQDGRKEVDAAEAQRAMGKLAEIIGKRSQEVSGEMSVETPSGREQLRTAYSGKVAEHSNTGGEINRDEIPLAYQDYIRTYMERVHREATAAKP